MPTDGILPTFLIAGAPKSGTTSMSDYLRLNPSVFMSDPKEPFYWCFDFPGLRNRTRIDTAEKYCSLFDRSRPCHSAIGEATTLYLYSRHAIREIAASIPTVRVVIMLRNPIDIAYAFHMQQVFMFQEYEGNFAKAWNLQAERRQGVSIPANCIQPELLQYGAVARLGEQLTRLYEHIPACQVLLMFFDDFVSNPRASYCSLLSFIGANDDGRTQFPRSNEAMGSRSRIVAELFRHHSVNRLSAAVRRTFPAPVSSALRRAKDALIRRRYARPPLDSHTRSRLSDAFSDDVALIERYTNRNLRHWLAPVELIEHSN